MMDEEIVVREDIASAEDVRAWQRQLVRGVLRVLVGVGPLAVAAGSYYAYTTQTMWLVPFYLVAYALALVLTFWPRAPYALQAAVILALIYGLGILDFFQDGRGGSARIFLLGFLALSVLFLGRSAGGLALALAVVTMAAFGLAFSVGWLTIPIEHEANSADPVGWLSNTVVMLLMGALIVASQIHLVPRLTEALTRSRRLAAELAQERAQLQQRVEQRTAELARRSAQLQTAAQVAREAAAIRDADRLLEATVRLISERFGFYHAGLFLLDENKEYAVLRAASSEGGQTMLARGHRLRVGEMGIVGYVAGSGEPRVALDVGADAVFFDNPDLPLTRSEMALPLRVRGELIGVLDVQSTEPEAFTGEDVTILQTLADQVAVAISNARLFQQAQESLEAERQAYGELSRHAWQEVLRARSGLRKRYDPRGILPREGQRRTERGKGTSILGQASISRSLSVPIRVRGQVIGVLDAHKPDGAGDWTSDEGALLETLADQLGVALDSARLYEDTQRLAARERLASEVTARMRETLDLETVLRTAVDEMYEALGLAEVAVCLTAGTDGEQIDG